MSDPFIVLVIDHAIDPFLIACASIDETTTIAEAEAAALSLAADDSIYVYWINPNTKHSTLIAWGDEPVGDPPEDVEDVDEWANTPQMQWELHRIPGSGGHA